AYIHDGTSPKFLKKTEPFLRRDIFLDIPGTCEMIAVLAPEVAFIRYINIYRSWRLDYFHNRAAIQVFKFSMCVLCRVSGISLFNKVVQKLLYMIHGIVRHIFALLSQLPDNIGYCILSVKALPYVQTYRVQSINMACLRIKQYSPVIGFLSQYYSFIGYQYAL